MTTGGVTVCMSQSETQTVALGRWLAAHLKPGDVIALVGELGAGKTRLVRGLAEGLGIAPDRTHSPTYVLANVYERESEAPLAHVDAYRLHGAGELEDLGWDRLDDGKSIVVVEWADRLGGTLGSAERLFHILIEHVGVEERRITITWPPGRRLDGLQLGE